MKILVIGGTQFVGRHLVEKLLAANHQVTLLNRGKSAPELFRDAQHIQADRTSEDLDQNTQLRQHWDAVIDMCAYYPAHVSRLLHILKGRAGCYLFCSTASVYSELSFERPTPLLTEESPLLDCTPEQARDTTLATYGQRKAECERTAMNQHATGVPTVIVRPSLIYGAYDLTDRFAYWIWRVVGNKPFVLPDDGLTTTRRTYAPDLAAAMISCLNTPVALGSVYNIAETDPLNFRDTIFYIGKYLKKDALENAVPVPADRLLKHDIKPWTDLPLWLPRMNLMMDTFKSRRDLGFESTPPEKALSQATEAFLALGRAPKAGISMEAEAQLLKRLGLTGAILPTSM